MSETVYIKRGDTAPAMRVALKPETVNLTGALVRVQIRLKDGAMTTDVPATIITATGTPTVQHQWSLSDTATAGLYEAEFRVQYQDGTVETFPNDGFIRIIVTEDIE